MLSVRKLLPFSRFLIVAACGALMGAPCAARADRHHAYDENKSLQSWATLFGPVLDPPLPSPLVPAAQPDYILFHTGSVDLTANLRRDEVRGSITVSVQGYAAGAYSVSAVTVSSGSTVALGSLTVSNPVLSGSFFPMAVKGAASAPAIIIGTGGFGSGSAEFGGGNAPFPKGFSPFDVASVSVSDSNGDLVSTAALTPVTNGYYTAESPLDPSKHDRDARGFALIRANRQPLFYTETALAAAAKPALEANVVSGGVVTTGSLSIWHGPVPISPIVIDPIPIIFPGSTGELVIHAHHLPPKTALTYAADGTDLGTATTDSAGNLSVNATQNATNGTLPIALDLFSVEKVTVHDASGKVYASADF